jgi:hypothetical protein
MGRGRYDANCTILSAYRREGKKYTINKTESLKGHQVVYFSLWEGRSGL